MFFASEHIGNVVKELDGYIHADIRQVGGYKAKECGYGSFGLLGEDPSGWEDFGPESRWGGRDTHCWFKTSFEIPEEFEGKTAVYHVKTERSGWDALNPQFMVFVNGRAVQGLDVNHTEVFLADCARAHDVYRIDLYAYSGMNEGQSQLISDVSILQKDVEKLYYHIKVPLEVALLLNEDDKRRVDILNHLSHAINLLDFRRPFSQEFNASVAQATVYLDEEFYGKFCGGGDVTEICVGHTHIDVAWLWPLRQTREKAARSFSTVLELMKRYPDYVFMSSQPQTYEYVKEDHPEIFEEIKNMIKAGRWEAEGAMWLEADCNLVSGESLVRQILFGTRFFRKEFGIENKILWLPDVFGYSAALPQILKKSGIDYFMTTKISWNEFNKLPYDTFLWRGIDGTEILSYFITTKDYEKGGKVANFTTYNGDINASQVMGCWQRFQQKEITSEVLNCFGYGDGGGGPTREMLENAQRLDKGIPGAPTVRIGSAIGFFHRLEEKVKNNKWLPKWVGELYLEFHRGTYTTMARNKKYNRRTEFLNLEAELLSTAGSVLAGTAYPQEEINSCWKTTLLNQFHDIIPGSSIKEVYEESKEQYERINAVAGGIISKSQTDISALIKMDTSSAVVFNQLSFENSGIASFALPQGWSFARIYDGGREVDTQLVKGGAVIFYAESVPAKGYKTFALQKADAPAAGTMTVEKGRLENAFFDIRFDQNGNITSLTDKTNCRQVLMSGQRANLLEAFEDKPHEYDAWNVDIYYQEKMWEVNDVISIEALETGPVRSSLKIKKRFLDSVIEQTVCLYNRIGRIDFDTTIDWKEKQIMLKAAFPVDIHSDKATYEIQYGNVERPTHWNTSWDQAKFEVCAHKWADLSEGGYGVSLLNDCKYGHDIKDSVMRLTLLRSTIYPNPDADREVHHFVYSLYPHSGDWKAAGTAREAYSLNCPMTAIIEQPHAGSLPGSLSFVSVDRNNVMVEVVKKAEDSGDVIVRLYEYQNMVSNVKCSFCRPLKNASECDLMERDIETLPVDDCGISFTIKPYEIKTFKVSF